MDLNTIWFILVALLFCGYFLLEGFDFGVGIQLPFLTKDDTKRRVIINTIGPHWDGNEVWLVAAGGATFAAFPGFYATLFSGFYLPFFIILLALIIRGVAFEFRSKEDHPLWRSFWDWSISIGSLIPALLWGIALSNLVFGVPVNASFNYTGGFWNLLNPFAIIGGLITVIGFILHGALFITLKTTDVLSELSRRVAVKMWLPLLVLLIIYTVIANSNSGLFSKPNNASIISTAMVILSVFASGLTMRFKMDKMSFLLSSVAVVLASATIFLGLYPDLMISSLNADWSPSIYNSSSSPYTLRVMSIVAAIFIPFILAVQAWTYWVFRKRITAKLESLEY